MKWKWRIDDLDHDLDNLDHDPNDLDNDFGHNSLRLDNPSLDNDGLDHGLEGLDGFDGLDGLDGNDDKDCLGIEPPAHCLDSVLLATFISNLKCLAQWEGSELRVLKAKMIQIVN